MGLPSAVYSNGSQDALYGMSFNSRGELFAAHSMRSSVDVNMQLNGIRVYSRRFFADRPLNPRELPQPVIVNRAQRPGTTLVDIDYKVVDADSATVHVAMLGFTNGSMDVPDLVLMTNFVENSFTNLGTGIPANQIRRVTWNLATDWNVGFGTFDIHVMAKDERGLFPFRFIQVPASGGDPAIFVSEKELTNPDLNNSWLWLIATGDPAIRLTNGEVFGVGGAYDNQRLTFSNVTTPPGRAFLYQRFGVRAATAADATRANAGRYGFPPRLDLVNNVATPTVTTDFVVKLP